MFKNSYIKPVQNRNSKRNRFIEEQPEQVPTQTLELESYIVKALGLQRQGLYNDAISIYQAQEEISPSDPKPKFYKARCLDAMLQYNDALAVINSASELLTDDSKREEISSQILHCKARILQNLGDYDSAIDIYNSLIGSSVSSNFTHPNPNNYMEYECLIACLRRAGRYFDANYVCTDALNRFPFQKAIRALDYHVDSHSDSFNFESMKKGIKEIYNSNFHDALSNHAENSQQSYAEKIIKAYDMLGCGLYSGSLKVINQALDLTRNYDSLYNISVHKGVILEKLCNYDDAIAVYDNLIKLQSENYIGYEGRITCLRNKGDYVQAFRESVCSIYRFPHEQQMILAYENAKEAYNINVETTFPSKYIKLNEEEIPYDANGRVVTNGLYFSHNPYNDSGTYSYHHNKEMKSSSVSLPAPRII